MIARAGAVPMSSYTPASERGEQVFVPSPSTLEEDAEITFMSDDILVMRCRGPISGKRYLISMRKLEAIASREGWTFRLTKLESGVFAYVVL